MVQAQAIIQDVLWRMINDLIIETKFRKDLMNISIKHYRLATENAYKISKPAEITRKSPF